MLHAKREPGGTRMTSSRVVVGIVVIAALAAASVQARAAAEPTATRVVDRTLVCKVGMANGARSITVTAQSAFRKGDRLEWLAQATVATPGNPVPAKRNEYLPTLVGMTAGWPGPGAVTSGGLGISLALCSSSRSTVPLSPRGLGGGAAGQLGEELKCVTASRVRVRVRATFAAPVTLELDRKNGWQGASARIEKGQLAVRTLSGKPLVYADVVDSGKARVFTARSCF